MRAAFALATALALLICSGCNTISEALLVARKLSEPPAATGGSGGPYANRNAKAPVRNDGAAINPDDVEAALKAMEGGNAARPQLDKKFGKPPADQEISVNLIFAGATPAAKGKNLDFDFQAHWGTYKSDSRPVTMPSSQGSSEVKLDLGVAKAKIVPKIVSATRGNYDLTLTDKSGNLLGGFKIADSGQQVQISRQPSKYNARLLYFHDENRLTGYEIVNKSTGKPELGVIFVGKGWSYVEKSKKPDMSKGYIFPEVDMVVLPKAWLEDNEMKDTCNTLKRGDVMSGGGICYS
jgi:hypothetical protein